MHDVWYQYGFNEQTGNFQYNNFGRGGLDLDNVIAEGLDFIDGARNNEILVLQSDGYPAHMQMYVWQKPNQIPSLLKRLFKSLKNNGVVSAISLKLKHLLMVS